MKCYLIFFVGILLFSCAKKHDDAAISMSIEKRDSLLIQYIKNEFKLEDYEQKLHWEQLHDIRANKKYTLDTLIKNYRLESFVFGSHQRPFVVEVVNNDDQFITFFSFTDESFYSTNAIDSRKLTSPPETDSVLNKKLNLETNLNKLIVTLGLKTENEIFDFMNVLFCYLLRMDKIDKDAIKAEIETTFNQLIIGDSIYRLVNEEESVFFKKGNSKTLMIRARTGTNGYWKFWLKKEGNMFIVKTTFFSDILFVQIYL